MTVPPVLTSGQRTSLAAKLRTAESKYRSGQPCTALNVLGAFMNEAQALRRGNAVAVAEDLYARARQLRRDLASRLPATVKCTCPETPSAGVTVKLLASDVGKVRARVTFGAPGITSVTAAGETFTQVTLPGTMPVGDAGMPGVPVVNRLIAVPQGADVSVTTSAPVVAERLKVNLFPFQSEPADQDVDQGDAFGDRPFAKDPDAYASPGPFPPAICTIRPLGQVRDLRVAQVSCAAGQYNPVSDVLTLFRSVDFEVRFAGGTEYFLGPEALMPFEPPIELFLRRLLNEKEATKHVSPFLTPKDCEGEELLIVAHQGLKAPAEGLATWKRTKGIPTTVITVDGETTAAQIDAYIESRYDHCTVRLSYVLLLGDAELVPTFYVATEFAPYTGSDYRYAAYPQFIFDIVPHFAVGRIPVDTVAEAWTVVNKIIGYESNPPLSVSFYKNVSFASQFQCCRWDKTFGSMTYAGQDQRGFVEVSESMRSALLSQGYTVQRIYTETVDTIYAMTGKSQVPTRYYDGTLLPTDLGSGSGFGWSGDTNAIAAAFNQGRFLFVHRDHGSWNRWSNPELTRDQVASAQFIANGALLPVVFSLNCSTGLFDNETNPAGDRTLDPGSPYPSGSGVQGETYFAERMLRRANGGAVAVIGATRDSPSWANNALTRGLFDAVWPGTVSTYSAGTSTRRLGDMLNYAKLYVFTEMTAPDALVDVSVFQDVVSELFLWHVFGDPTLEMWTSRPVTLPAVVEVERLLSSLLVHYGVEDATITAFQLRWPIDADTLQGPRVRPIGRAHVKDGVAELPFVLAPWEDTPVLLAACARDAVCTPLVAGERN